AGRRVADQLVREGQRVPERPEDVRLEEVERLVDERVPVPGDLPGLDERIAEILRYVAAEMERQRPVHREREHAAAQDGERQLPASQWRHPRIRHEAPWCTGPARDPFK